MASLDDELTTHFVHATDELKWIPLSLTLVEYPRGDIFGKLLALVSLAPFIIVTSFITLILFRRDLHTILFFSGIILNEFINLILKHIIREPRPLKRDGIYNEYGMPSSHAQFMWFFTAYAILFIYIRLHHNSNSTISERFWRIIIVTGCIITAVLVSYGRIYLQYHTTSQVLWGLTVGAILGVLWFLTTHIILTPLFPIIVSWQISEYLLLRDTSSIPDILWFEYTNIRTEVRSRSRKFVSMKSQ
ncbi:dolichyldiphosphatase 1-like [Polistes fuscatus]|uniref:dolichyldiphosphatase 1-like n=1 Tax=Polistes fuscatus TaxID=30207 RepID=UPI001CA7FC0C|nr:dolichyldiphosphatase 1-like [Polistes fuscatus]